MRRRKAEWFGGLKCFGVAVVASLLVVSIGDAVERVELGTPEGWVSGGLLWTSGTVGFDEIQPTWRSRLEYPVDGWLLEFRGGARRAVEAGRQPAYLTISGRYAASMSVEGRSADFDWDSSGSLSDYSHSDCTADVRTWEVKLAWSTVFSEISSVESVEFGVQIGCGADWFDFFDENLDVVYDYGQTVYSVSGPLATYQIEFTGIRLGGFAEVHPCEPLRVRVELDWIPFLHAEADALWIQRDYPFWQEADGQGVILTLRGDWTLSPSLSLFAGVRYVSLIADEDGVESGVLDGMGYEDSPIVSEMTSEYFGLDVGVGWHF